MKTPTTPTDYANNIFPPDQDGLLPASHDWATIREQVAQAVRAAIGDTRRCLIRVTHGDDIKPGVMAKSFTLQCGICYHMVTYVSSSAKGAERVARADGWLKTEQGVWRCPYHQASHDRPALHPAPH